MKKIRWLMVLMWITVLIITGFQVYWLKDNYDREKHILEIRANVNFQETVRRLQAAKLKLPDPDTVHHQKMRVMIDDDLPDINQPDMKRTEHEEIITLVNSLHEKLKDSPKKPGRFNSRILISSGKNIVTYNNDSMPGTFDKKIDLKGDRIINYLYGIDSLQDTLKLSEIINSYSKTLKENSLSIPFTITRFDTLPAGQYPAMSEVTLGFARPVTYHLQLGSTFNFLAKKITLPVLFSIFLVSITIFSFVLFYRNLVRQHQLAEIKNDFISNITHELKTPISTVSVAVEALKSFNAINDPERTKEYLTISSNELQRLGLLIDKVLKLSMFEKKKIELKKEKFDLKELFEEVLSTLKFQFEKSKAIVSLDTQGNNFVIEADRLHLTSVIYNLLDNALKYGGDVPEIKVKILSHQTFIEFTIRDNGIGIEKEFQAKIFEKFFRVPTGNTHNIKGYGLGLSYVSEIVKKHMGFTEVSSVLGKGSIFTVKLPYAEAPVIHYDGNRTIRKINFKQP